MGNFRIPMLDLAGESAEVGESIRLAIGRVLNSGQFILGPEVAAFEREVANALNVRYAVALNSGTDALTLGLQALEVAPGDEVITSPFSFVAAAEAIRRVGAVPVFADIASDSFHLDPAAVRRVITARTKALIPVHLYGEVAGFDELLDVADRFSLSVLEDTAQAFGAEWAGRKVGTWGHAGAFSFFPSKPLGAYGDGGLLVSNDESVVATVRQLARHGSRVKYFSELVGYNSRLDEVQAAILRIKLPRVDEWNRRRRDIAAQYSDCLESLISEVVVPSCSGPNHVVHQYTIRIRNDQRDLVKQTLADAGIASTVYYPTLVSSMEPYGKLSDRIFPFAAQAKREVLSLPVSPWLHRDSVNEVCERIANVLTG